MHSATQSIAGSGKKNVFAILMGLCQDAIKSVTDRINNKKRVNKTEQGNILLSTTCKIWLTYNETILVNNKQRHTL